MYKIVGMSVDRCAHELKTPANYEAACTSCEVKVHISTAADLNEIRLALVYDKRKAGNRGRCLNINIERFNLRAKDRLEPTIPGLPDVGQFENLVPPCDVVFRRNSCEGITRHRSPVSTQMLGAIFLQWWLMSCVAYIWG